MEYFCKARNLTYRLFSVYKTIFISTTCIMLIPILVLQIEYEKDECKTYN